MLVQCIIDNYLSFNERQEFSMFMGRSRIHQNRVKTIGDNGLLKFAAIFGANASGKVMLSKPWLALINCGER